MGCIFAHWMQRRMRRGPFEEILKTDGFPKLLLYKIDFSKKMFYLAQIRKIVFGLVENIHISVKTKI